ncbi:MAG: hypothetical protein ACR2KQ_09165 [Actinomycetota bacterium]
MIHVLDHLRQGRSVGVELNVVGVVSVVATVIALVLAVQGHPLAKPAAILLGVGTFVGLLAVHVAPTWWVLSDSYGDAGVDALSWLIVIAMIVAAAVLAIQAWSVRLESAGTRA